jgi:hypothetical protein
MSFKSSDTMASSFDLCQSFGFWCRDSRRVCLQVIIAFYFASRAHGNGENSLRVAMSYFQVPNGLHSLGKFAHRSPAEPPCRTLLCQAKACSHVVVCQLVLPWLTLMLSATLALILVFCTRKCPFTTTNKCCTTGNLATTLRSYGS